MDNKKELAIVLGATGNMTFALANVLFGIKKHINSIKYDVFVYYKDISDKEKQILNSIIPVNLIEYNFPLIEISKHSKNRYSLLAYSRYECFDYLDKYKKVLWLYRRVYKRTSIRMALDSQKMEEDGAGAKLNWQ